MKRYPIISLREPPKKARRKPVGFHVDEGSFLLSLLLVLGTLGAMTTFAERYHVAEGKYDHLRPEHHIEHGLEKVASDRAPRAEFNYGEFAPIRTLPEKFKGGADRFDDIFAAYAQNPEAFALQRKGKPR